MKSVVFFSILISVLCSVNKSYSAAEGADYNVFDAKPPHVEPGDAATGAQAEQQQPLSTKNTISTIAGFLDAQSFARLSACNRALREFLSPINEKYAALAANNPRLFIDVIGQLMNGNLGGCYWFF